MSSKLTILRPSVLMLAAAAAVAGWATTAGAGDALDGARVRRAIALLDARQDAWAAFARAGRGEGDAKTTCVSCHTGLSFALARPALGRFVAEPDAAAPVERMNAALRLRTLHWAELDSPQYELMYDSDDRKKAESRGTEAVLNALILARDDAARGLKEPSPATRTALDHLWATQATEGEQRGLVGLAQLRSRPLGRRPLARVRRLPRGARRQRGPRVLECAQGRRGRAGRSLARRIPPPAVPRGAPLQPPLDPRGGDHLRGPALGRTEAGRRRPAPRPPAQRWWLGGSPRASGTITKRTRTARRSPRIPMATRPAWRSTSCSAQGCRPAGPSWPGASPGSDPTSRRTAPGRAAQ